ncbi:hypothetical protein, partial [Ellagibacter isourolithinifaciens]
MKSNRLGRLSAACPMCRSRIAVAAFAILLVAFAGFLMWLNAGIDRVPLRPTGGSEFEKATVDEVISSDV